MPSPGRGTIGQPVVIVLTDSARIHIEKQQIDLSACAKWLSPDCQTGDIVTVSSAGVRHDFAVMRRRWVIGDVGRSLEVTLDYPVRGR